MGATGVFRTMNSTRLLSNVIANEIICASEALDRIDENLVHGVAKKSRMGQGIVGSINGDRTII